MLSKFIVKNFKNFKDEITLDFSASDYQFNDAVIKNGLANKSIIYGPNGSGKSNIGFAIFDIVRHLTDNNVTEQFYTHYTNKISLNSPVEFEYYFQFGKNEVIYKYKKDKNSVLLDENLTINNKETLSIQRTGSDNLAKFNLKGSEKLNTNIATSDISIINYVQKNTVLDDNNENSIFNKFYNFINKMLFFSSTGDSSFLGLEKSGRRSVAKDIIEHGNVDDFERFLNKAGIDCNLKVISESGDEQLVFNFDGEYVPFYEIASQGTKSLSLVYFWYQRLRDEDVSFVFIDEFDAFYHQKLSEIIIQLLKKVDAQVVLTTHNTSIMSNDLLRPDCYFLIDKGKITAINRLTDKELRKAHNLEKLYNAGKFN